MMRVSLRVLACAGSCAIWFVAVSVCDSVSAADRVDRPVLVLASAKTSQASFEVRGLPPEVAAELRRLPPRDPRWSSIFNVHVATTKGDQPPMLGSYEPTSEGVRFRPRFPLERGIEYRAVFDWPVGGGPQNSGGSGRHFRLAESFAIPVSRAGPPARVLAIYPSGREVPENLLRLYIQFSAPMSQGNCYSRLHLRDETTGTDVPQPFLELPQELWSLDGTRLTLLLEPGRVKHDLVPRGQLGPILVAGRSYALTVDSNWPDAEGRPLSASACKKIRAVKAESKQLDPNAWTIETPLAKTRKPLSVRFPKPLDRAMLERVLRVLGPTNAEIAGAIHVTNEETLWTFEPRERWLPGHYVLAVSTMLEDPAGNSVGRPFEVDLKRSPNLPQGPAFIRIGFDLRERP
jgi:hypothetical protein